jgi:glycosyltransferase involved in cell wall biosynthesis
MRILLSAYACEPQKGSEPGAGYAILRAATHHGECWVLTRTNNIAALSEALESEPPPNPVHVVPVDLAPAVLRAKRATGAVRSYYWLWQRKARRVAALLDAGQPFDVVHHATFSAFWLPIGMLGLNPPLVLGPIGGATFTPRPLLRYLGPKGLVFDAVRYIAIQGSARFAGGRIKRKASVFIAQNEQMLRFAQRHLVGPGTLVVSHPHSSDPEIVPTPIGSVRDPAVLWVGRLVPWKGGELAIRSFALARLPEEVSLSIVGDGPDLERLRRVAQRLGVEQRVQFMGSMPRDQVLARMRTSRALLCSSLHDAAPFVVAEALALGVPVVCLDHGGPPALTRIWTETPSTAIPVRPARRVIQRLAATLETYVLDPLPIPNRPRPATVSMTEVLGRAYAAAIDQGPR